MLAANGYFWPPPPLPGRQWTSPFPQPRRGHPPAPRRGCPPPPTSPRSAGQRRGGGRGGVGGGGASAATRVRAGGGVSTACPATRDDSLPRRKCSHPPPAHGCPPSPATNPAATTVLPNPAALPPFSTCGRPPSLAADLAAAVALPNLATLLPSPVQLVGPEPGAGSSYFLSVDLGYPCNRTAQIKV